MSANFLNTNRNADRYFFATVENGEQDLGLAYGTTGGVVNLSTMSVTLSGGGGSVIVNQAPQFAASEFVVGEQALLAGTDSTYFTMSTLTSSIVGVNISSDRASGTGTACIESYAANGSLGGFEFLSRGLNAALISTTNVDTNNYLTAIGRPGATAALGASGTFVTGTLQSAVTNNVQSVSPAGAGCYNIQDLSGGSDVKNRWSIGKFGATPGSNAGSDLAVFSYADDGTFLANTMSIKRSDGAVAIGNLSSVNGVPYPQNLLSTLMTGTQGVLANSNVVSLLFSHNSAATSNMIPGQNYLIDVPAIITTGAPGGSGAWLDLGIRAGSNGSFNYVQSMFIPPGGTPAQGVGQGVIQICDMGSVNANIDIVGYLQGVASLSISTSQVGGGALAFMKMMT
jgi:hypothetical protein